MALNKPMAGSTYDTDFIEKESEKIVETITQFENIFPESKLNKNRIQKTFGF
ncbi:MAG TPA: hypothetical protein VK498_03100 [Ferruginibacter sp.]|nr:hypothetical protein [Ferruginibacter sp.]